MAGGAGHWPVKDDAANTSGLFQRHAFAKCLLRAAYATMGDIFAYCFLAAVTGAIDIDIDARLLMPMRRDFFYSAHKMQIQSAIISHTA